MEKYDEKVNEFIILNYVHNVHVCHKKKVYIQNKLIIKTRKQKWCIICDINMMYDQEFEIFFFVRSFIKIVYMSKAWSELL